MAKADPVTHDGFCKNYAEAREHAARDSRRLVVWVGGICAPCVKSLKDYLHVKVEKFQDCTDGAALIEGRDGEAWLVKTWCGRFPSVDEVRDARLVRGVGGKFHVSDGSCPEGNCATGNCSTGFCGPTLGSCGPMGCGVPVMGGCSSCAGGACGMPSYFGGGCAGGSCGSPMMFGGGGGCAGGSCGGGAMMGGCSGGSCGGGGRGGFFGRRR